MQIERQLQILAQLGKDGNVRVSDLSRRLGVSQNTIRRDLQRLEDQGLAIVTYGGAVSKQNLAMGIPYEQRREQFKVEKRRIGARAAEMVHSGEAIIVDAGTTTERMIPALSTIDNITVVTNALNIAAGLVGKHGINTVLAGGPLNAVTISTVGVLAESFLSQFHVKTAFIGAGGISVEGVTGTNAFEVQIKRTMIACADVVVFLGTHDKIGRMSLVPVAPLADIDIIITDDKADPQYVSTLRSHGVEVILC